MSHVHNVVCDGCGKVASLDRKPCPLCRGEGEITRGEALRAIGADIGDLAPGSPDPSEPIECHACEGEGRKAESDDFYAISVGKRSAVENGEAGEIDLCSIECLGAVKVLEALARLNETPRLRRRRRYSRIRTA